MIKISRQNILVADDDPGILEVIKIILEENGFKVIPVSDGHLILKTIKDTKPDLILLDIWMSGTDGRKIATIIKKQNVTKHIPILIISALSEIEDIAKSVGADGYISKPFDIDEFLSTIKKFV